MLNDWSTFSLSLSNVQQRKVEEAIEKIVVLKTETILHFVESIRENLTSKDVSLREASINELSVVLLQLPDNVLNSQIGNFMLEFLLPRVEDSGHVAADSLITAIYFLVIRCGADLSLPVLMQAIRILYETNGVQSYAQRDRMILFNLLYYFLDNFFKEIQMHFDSAKFIILFMRAVNSERDPRCLLKIFDIFNVIARNFPLGILAEDMFEMIACYYPIDYEPNKTEKSNISSSMLSESCESCLTANRAFAPFCFQLISEKFLDDNANMENGELHLKQQISLLNFLCKACKSFNGLITTDAEEDLRKELENFLTAFRLICINPLQKKHTLLETNKALTKASTAVAMLFQNLSNPSRDMRFMAENTIENCEPFVLQAEMGLTGKILIVLQAIAESSIISLQIIVPKVLYWFNVLLTGTTIKSPTNKQEIVEEVAELLPTWFLKAYILTESNTDNSDVDLLWKSMEDIYKALNSAEDFCDYQNILGSKLICAYNANFFLFKQNSENNIYRRIYLISEQLLLEIFNLEVFIKKANTSLLIIQPRTLKSAKDFIAAYCLQNFEDCCKIIEPQILKLFSMSSLQDNNDLAKAGRQWILLILGSAIINRSSARWIASLLFDSNIFYQFDIPTKKDVLFADYCLVIVEIIRSLSINFSTSLNNEFEDRKVAINEFLAEFSKFVVKNINELALLEVNNSLKFEQFANLLQDVGLYMNEEQHFAFTKLIFDTVFEGATALKNLKPILHIVKIVSLLFMQTTSLKYLANYIKIVNFCIQSLLLVKENSDTKINSIATKDLYSILINSLFCLKAKEKYYKNKSLQLFQESCESIYRYCDSVAVENSICIEEKCGWCWRLEISKARALLLTNSREGHVAVSKLLESIIMTENGSALNLNTLLPELLNFHSRAVSPVNCGLEHLKVCTAMWRQRVFCQFVPIFVVNFNKIPKEKVPLQIAFLHLIDPLLQLAKSVKPFVSQELKMILPILIQTFSLMDFPATNISGNTQNNMNINLLLLLDSTLELLQITATLDDLLCETDCKRLKLPNSMLAIFINAFIKILNSKDLTSEMEVVLKCFECLEVLARKVCSSTHNNQFVHLLRPFYTQIIKAAIQKTKSRKRCIRQHAANIRNLWFEAFFLNNVESYFIFNNLGN